MVHFVPSPDYMFLITPLLPVNKAKVLHGLPRDPDLAAALAELEEEENENSTEEEKPKVLL